MPDPTGSISAPAISSDLRFGRFELQGRERRLLVDGKPANLGGRALDMLLLLARRAGHLVTKSELLDEVWPGLVVEESNLHVQISALRKVVGSELIATVPGRGYRFNAEPQVVAWSGPAPTPAGAAAMPPPAVPAARMIGRADDLAHLQAVLAAGRCVTLVGPAGVGKTRLAQAAVLAWPGRRLWVDLAALPDAAQVPGALARALGIPLPDSDAAAALARALRGDAALVVLDNAEHLVAAVASLVDALLLEAPQVHWLVTSQVPLAIAAERVHRLEPLALPGTLDDAAALADGALALLVERITAAHHRFRPDAATLPLLRELCTRLDGLPLALEMAAARVPLLGVKGVCDALATRFSLLTAGHRTAPGRHRTLHAALDWSYALLPAPAQRLFRCLGVFAGSFTLELAVAAAAGDGADRWELIDHLAALVDRSIVAVGPEAAPRYRLLDTMRAYALEQLAAGGEEDAVRARVAGALLQLFRSNPAAVCLPEMDNVREALAWARRRDGATAVALSTAVTAYTTFTPWRNEAFAWLFACEPLLVPPLTDALDPALHATWWRECARGLLIRLNPRATAAARRACELSRAPGMERELHAALVAYVRSLDQPGPELDAAYAELMALTASRDDWPLVTRLATHGASALVHGRRRDYAQGLEARRAELALAREGGLRNAADAAETNIVYALGMLGRHEEAAALGRDLVGRLGASGSGNAPWAWSALVTSLIALGRHAEAREALAGANAAYRRLDLPTLGGHEALLAAIEQRPRAAARLVGHARQAYASRGMRADDQTRTNLDQAEHAARRALGDAGFDALAAEGRALDDEAAAAIAVSRDDG